ncbi:MAG: four helix bundle protein [Saprospiraceae bacterium]|nr:four helix bundle protein [Saprospiraceae bacterium]
MNAFELETRLIGFASRVMDLVENLPTSLCGKHLGGQLLRSGTAPALNYGEAQGAESREDFIHKMKVCLKELRETMANLRIIQLRNYFPNTKMESLIKENNELISIFVASTKTAVVHKKQKP